MKLQELLGIKYPIIQGAMANISTGEFAASASNAGAMGIIASGGMDSETLRQEIRICKSKTDKPFGVNVMLLNPEADLIAQVIVEEGVKFVTTGAGNPSKYMDMWTQANIKVFPLVSATIMAKKMEQLGASGIIVEGCEAGGHVGEATTMAVLPQIVEAVSIPVVSAGGIASGKQLLAAQVLGAVGAQIGTCLLVSEECPIHENYKDAIIKARDSDTIVTGRINGTPVRILKNKMAREYVKKEKEGASMEELEVYTLGALKKAVQTGDIKEGSLMAGQVAGMVRNKQPIKQILETIMNEYQEAKEKVRG